MSICMSDVIPESTPSLVTPPEALQSKEAWLGGVLVLVLCLLLLVLTGTFGYFGYRLWKAAQVEQSTPSIQELGEHIPPRAPDVNPDTSTPTTTPAISSALVQDKATVEVKVINGGAAKGSASTLTELLKKAGYTKATFGNSAKDHTGTIIYYSGSAQVAAETLKETVIKTYPKVTLAPAQAGDKDATAATVVVVLGKE